MRGKVLQLESERLIKLGKEEGEIIGETRGKAIGKAEGEARMQALIKNLLLDNRMDEVRKVVSNAGKYKDKLYKEYGL